MPVSAGFSPTGMAMHKLYPNAGRSKCRNHQTTPGASQWNNGRAQMPEFVHEPSPLFG
jgi:hypothetical protein